MRVVSVARVVGAAVLVGGALVSVPATAGAGVSGPGFQAVSASSFSPQVVTYFSKSGGTRYNPANGSRYVTHAASGPFGVLIRTTVVSGATYARYCVDGGGCAGYQSIPAANWTLLAIADPGERFYVEFNTTRAVAGQIQH